MNFCKKCSDCSECGDIKYFTAFHRISYKNSPHNAPHFLQNLLHRLLWQISVRYAVKAGNALKKKIFLSVKPFPLLNSREKSVRVIL